MKLFHIISNPVAGKDKSKKNLELVKGILDANGVPYKTHTSACEHDATEIVRKLTEEGATEIIALGGDGTLHEVLNGIADPSVCNLGLIPSGTGNDFAERAGIPLDAEKAMDLILKSEAKPTDYLEVDGVRCMNVAGFGIDVDVLERCKRGKLKGKIKYLLSLVQSLFAYKCNKVKIECEGKTEEREVLITATCNGSQFGGGLQICPVADIADGKIDVITVDELGGKLKTVKALLTLLKGKILEHPAARHFLCERICVTPEVPCTVQLDGEIYKNLRFDVSLKKGLKFYR